MRIGLRAVLEPDGVPRVTGEELGASSVADDVVWRAGEIRQVGDVRGGGVGVIGQGHSGRRLTFAEPRQGVVKAAERRDSGHGWQG